MADPRYELRPVGRVRAAGGAFRIEIDEAYRPALEGLAGFGHAIIVFWCHRVDKPDLRQTVTCTHPYTNGPETLGVFATRSPVRPNPIGITTAAIVDLNVRKGEVTVGFLDAEDGTPVLDIKAYQPSLDRIRDARTPHWCAHWPAWVEDSGSFDWATEFPPA